MKKAPGFVLALLLAGCSSVPQQALDQGTYDAAQRARLADAAQAGDAVAQYELGNAYCCGESGYWDTRQAIRWWCAAARQGLEQALAALATRNLTQQQCASVEAAVP